jgi:hypothetical protein
MLYCSDRLLAHNTLQPCSLSRLLRHPWKKRGWCNSYLTPHGGRLTYLFKYIHSYDFVFKSCTTRVFKNKSALMTNNYKYLGTMLHKTTQSQTKQSLYYGYLLGEGRHTYTDKCIHIYKENPIEDPCGVGFE